LSLICASQKDVKLSKVRQTGCSRAPHSMQSAFDLTTPVAAAI